MLGGVLFGQRFEGVGVLDVIDDVEVEVEVEDDVAVAASDVDGEVLLEIEAVVVEAVNEEVVEISWVDDVAGRSPETLVVVDEVDEPAATPGIS